MNKIIVKILLLTFLVSFSSCYKDENESGKISDEFYLRHEGADLPVWVKGNADSETFIIMLHGGPFDTALENAVWGHFDPLLEDYAMVFFDQRGGGFAHGARVENLNEAQFIEDIEVVVKLIQNNYPQAKSLFLMGHSYGGYLGTGFLKTGDNQLDFKGWIELCGTHNFPLAWQSSRRFSQNYIESKIDIGVDKELWQDRLNQLAEAPEEINTYDDLRIINGMAFTVAGDLSKGKSNFENPSWLYIISSPVGAGFSQHNLLEVDQMLLYGNHNPEMPNIVLPSLLVYGAEDPIATIEIAENGYEFLGTPEEDKYLVILENSGHNIWEFEIELFFSSIKDFVEEYK